MSFIIENWKILVGTLLFVLGFFRGTAMYRWVKFVRLLAESAWAHAETTGVLQDIKGAYKAGPFLDKFIELWDERFGEAPPPIAQGFAMRVAADESMRHKVRVLASPKSSTSSESEASAPAPHLEEASG